MAEQDYLYTESHEWIDSSGDVRRVGITHHAQNLMGDIVFADLPKPGKVVAKGDELLVIESPKAAASVYAPLSGEVIEVNLELAASPELINKSPFEEGWIVKIKPTNAAAEAASLKNHHQYQELVGG